MGKFIFRAQSPSGEVSGIEVANSAAAAVAQLASRGLTDIRLQTHVINASMPLDTHGLSEDEYARQYLQFQSQVGWPVFVRMFLRNNWSLWLIAIGVSAWLYWGGHLPWAASVLLLPVLLMAWGAWKYRDALLFNRILEHLAFGRWAQAMTAVETLANRCKDDSVQLEMAVHEACILARQGDEEGANAVMAIWRPVMELAMPGMFHTLDARVSLAKRDYTAVRDSHRQAAEISGGDAALTLDYALMEARYGSAARADCLMLDLDTASLPEHGQGFVPWVRGIIALRQGRTEAAVADLSQALTGIQTMADNPAVWPTLAMISGDLGMALLQLQDRARAAQAVVPVWPVLSAHGDPEQLATLREALGDVLSVA